MAVRADAPVTGPDPSTAPCAGAGSEPRRLAPSSVVTSDGTTPGKGHSYLRTEGSEADQRVLTYPAIAETRQGWRPIVPSWRPTALALRITSSRPPGGRSANQPNSAPDIMRSAAPCRPVTLARRTAAEPWAGAQNAPSSSTPLAQRMTLPARENERARSRTCWPQLPVGCQVAARPRVRRAPGRRSERWRQIAVGRAGRR